MPASGKWSFKVGLSPFKKIVFICFNEIPLKMMKNTFYFILKALFVLKGSRTIAPEENCPQPQN